MREIYSSPRPENIDRLVALFAEHGIETRVTNRSSYRRTTYQRASYSPNANRAEWMYVAVKYADDLPRARELLRDEVGIKPLTRHSEVLEAARQPGKKRSAQAVAKRVRTVALAVLTVAVVFVLVRMFTSA